MLSRISSRIDFLLKQRKCLEMTIGIFDKLKNCVPLIFVGGLTPKPLPCVRHCWSRDAQKYVGFSFCMFTGKFLIQRRQNCINICRRSFGTHNFNCSNG